MAGIVICSLVFLKDIHDESDHFDSLLLAEGKKGVSKGFYNGYGGKLEDADCHDMRTCTIRELRREAGGTIVSPADLRYCGTLHFLHPHGATGIGVPHTTVIEMDTYFAEVWRGYPIETEEFKVPQRFPIAALPYERMIPGTELWLPQMLQGRLTMGTITYGKNYQVLEYDLRCVGHI